MQLIGFRCPRCDALFEIRDERSEQWCVEGMLRERHSCPLCAKGVLRPTLDRGGTGKLLELTPKEMLDYFNGLGLPEEQATPEIVEELLNSNKVVGADLSVVMNAGRCVVERLRLDNGKVLHFAASGDGAMIYKVTEEDDARKGTELRDHSCEEGTEEHTSGRETSTPANVADH